MEDIVLDLSFKFHSRGTFLHENIWISVSHHPWEATEIEADKKSLIENADLIIQVVICGHLCYVHIWYPWNVDLAHNIKFNLSMSSV